MINLTKILLESGIDLGVNYSIAQMNDDIDILKNINGESFTSLEIADENVFIYLYNEQIGKALTNILRASRVLDDKDFIPGNGDYSNLKICIPGVYDEEILEHMSEGNYGNYYFYINIQLESDENDFLYDWVTNNYMSFNISWYSDDYNISEDDTYYDNINTALQSWVKNMFSL